MLSIKRTYKKIHSLSNNLGTYPCLAQSVKNRRFARKSLVKAFNELMPENEYIKDEAKQLIDYLEYLTNLAEEGEIYPNLVLGSVE